jgi:hypothetical protein
MSARVDLRPDEGVFELAGPESIWFWAHTCPTSKCPCRIAVVIATRESRDVLLERGAPVRKAWNDQTNYADAAAVVDGLVVFALDIDRSLALPIERGGPLDLTEHPDVRAVVERVDGDVLDSLGRLWLKGKGLPDPEQERLKAADVVLHGWKPGDLVAWGDVFHGVRNDLYELDGRLYQASELYCIVPDCDCGEVEVVFETSRPRGAPPPGSVTVKRAATAVLHSHKKGGLCLAQLWSAFEQRHPRYGERFGRRSLLMKTMGGRTVTESRRSSPVVPSARVRRNGPCPCGSGRKFKRCCAAPIGNEQA